METDQKIVDRFQELIDFEATILKNRKIGGGEKTTYPLLGRNRPTETPKFDKVDHELVKEWELNCLNLLKVVFGKDSDYYKDFKQLSNFFDSKNNYTKVNQGLSNLKAAKIDYEKGFFNKRVKENVISDDTEKFEKVTKNCDKEAERNTRIYLIAIFIFFILLLISLFSFGFISAMIITFGLFIVGFIVSTIFLREWTPAKLHERILELEKERIYKRFDINSK